MAAALTRVVVDKGGGIRSSAVLLEDTVVKGGTLVKDERTFCGNNHEEFAHVKAYFPWPWRSYSAQVSQTSKACACEALLLDTPVRS